jgi:transposase
LVTDEAWEELEEAMKEGQIASIAQAHAFLAERGIIYADPSSVGQLLKRRQVKLKTGRPRHHKASPEQRQRFKKGRRERQAR